MVAPTTKMVMDNIFNGTPLPPTNHYPVLHHYSVVGTDNDGVIARGISFEQARAIRDDWRLMFGGTYNIVETETIARGKKLFSGEISQETPHVSSHDRPIDPMELEVGVFDASWLIDLVAANQPLDITLAAPDFSKPPVPPVTRVRKARHVRSVTRERTFSGISDPAVLMTDGYVVIDTRSQERCFVGTKSLCMEYIANRNVPHSRDALPINTIRVIRYSAYAEYQADVEANGFIAHHRGNRLAVGTRDDVEKVLRPLIQKEKITVEHVSVDRVSGTDLWWVQNRYDELRKVAS